MQTHAGICNQSGIQAGLHVTHYSHISYLDNRGFSRLGLYADILGGTFIWHLSVQFYPNSWRCLAC